MEVTRVKIDKYTPDEPMKANCTVVLDNSLCIHQIHVIEGKNGLFIAFPNTGDMKLYRKSKRFVSIAHPCTCLLYYTLHFAILAAYLFFNLSMHFLALFGRK